jgi:hypothetical protein
VYIGRPSKWGNHYEIGKDGNREEVIDKYEQWFLGSPLLYDLGELRGKILGCWCHPKRCHGDVLLACAWRLMEIEKCVKDRLKPEQSLLTLLRVLRNAKFDKISIDEQEETLYIDLLQTAWKNWPALKNCGVSAFDLRMKGLVQTTLDLYRKHSF